MFGLTFEKLLIIAVIGAFLIGPSKLPLAAAELGRWVRRLRALADSTTERLREEVGPEFDDIDWRKLDPRQYDPRQIVRRALEEPIVVAAPPAPPEEPEEVGVPLSPPAAAESPAGATARSAPPV